MSSKPKQDQNKAAAKPNNNNKKQEQNKAAAKPNNRQDQNKQSSKSRQDNKSATSKSKDDSRPTSAKNKQDSRQASAKSKQDTGDKKKQDHKKEEHKEPEEYNEQVEEPKKTRAEREREKAKEKRDAEHAGHICVYETIELPIPLEEIDLEPTEFKYASPEVSHAKVMPQKPSEDKKYGIPDPPDKKELNLKKPKSGIFINVKQKVDDGKDSVELMLERELEERDVKLPREPHDPAEDSEESVYSDYEEDEEQQDQEKKEGKDKPKGQDQDKEKKEPREKKSHRREKHPNATSNDKGQENKDGEAQDTQDKGKRPSKSNEKGGSGEGGAPEEAKKTEGAKEGQQGEEGKGEDTQDDTIINQVRKQVSQISKSTSLDPNEFFTPFEDFEDKGIMEKIIQKYRRDSDQLKVSPHVPKTINRGTLESHSFTNPIQIIHTDFYFGLRAGTVHQGDEHFSDISRNKQGLCNAVAAYCYNVVKHPDKWTTTMVDDILEVGDRLYMDSVDALHVHSNKRELAPEDLYRFCYVGKVKVRFKVHDPEITGMMRSTDKSVYNISKGLKLFFKRHCSAVLQSYKMNILVWRLGHYYIFDSTPKNNDLFPDENRGTAVLISLFSLCDVISVILDRYQVGNWPFKLFQITCTHVLDADAEDRESILSDYVEPNEFNILSGNKAVISGSFQLSDKCFDFSRNKQALPMSIISLIYSRITPPNAWRKKTIDKIMIIGNQLFLEISHEEDVEEVKLELIPAYFTIGPYMVEIFIYANRQTGFLYRKSVCQLDKALNDFFATANSGILEIDGGKYWLAIWCQRNMYYMFDPYARNKEGLKCRHGTACVTIDCCPEGLVDTLTKNFEDRESTFRIHAMKVLKIHRDPDRARAFPREQSMRDVPIEVLKSATVKTKRKRVATVKPVVIDVSDYAMRRLIEIIDSPGASINEIGSTVCSLRSNEIPKMLAEKWSMQSKNPDLFDIKPVDLDSPTLSDTQLDPTRPVPPKEEQPLYVDFTSDSFALTQEEIEIEEKQEGEGGEDKGKGAKMKALAGGEEEEVAGGEGGGADDAFEAKKQQMYEAQSKFSQVDEAGFGISKEVMTEDDTWRPLKRKILLPMNVLDEYERLRKQALSEQLVVPVEPEVTLSQELAKKTNFVTLPDDSQLIRGTVNIAQQGDDVEYMAPFVAMMCCPVSMKYSVHTWSTDIVDYILSCGAELYKSANVRYDQVPKLEIPKISLGHTDYGVVVDYLYDGQLKAKTLEKAIDKVLLANFKCGLVVTAFYAVAVFFKHHLYYMFDPFGCNECGMGEGPANTGVACFARFKHLKSLVGRFLHNKLKREVDENYSNTRFVLSSCVATLLIPGEEEKLEEKRKRRKKDLKRPKPDEFDDEDQMGEDYDDETTTQRDESQKPAADGDKKKKKAEEEEEKESKNKVGYQEVDEQWVIEGSKALQGRDKLSVSLKEDHFVCICACLMLLNHPVRKWDTKRVDQVLEQGKNIFTHADQLALSSKRTIKNILVGKRIFDIIVHKIPVLETKKVRGLNPVLDHMMSKRNYCIVQFPNCCYVIYKSNGYYHLFDPYSCSNPDKQKRGQSGNNRDREREREQNKKNSPREEKKEQSENKAGWTLFRTMGQVKKRIKANLVEGGNSYTLFSFDVTSITRAPKRMTVQYQLTQHTMDKELPIELFKKPFHEDEQWLKKNRKMAWSSVDFNAQGEPRGKNMWHNWEVEYPRDLFSIRGTIHQKDERFEVEIRGKQTLANLVVGIGMTDIYELSEWNTSIVDNVLVFGNEYFKECIKNIKEEKYEISTDDLIRKCTIYPYSFQVVVRPVLTGTMFLMSIKTFNLYKALRYFFKDVENRAGIICTLNGDVKRFLAFGKIQEMEYFIFDCQAEGSAVLLDGAGVTCFLRCTTMNRLLHCLVVTLRSGDFFIYDVITSNFSPVEDEDE